MTAERAREIFDAARAHPGAKIGPWSDQLDNVMTASEREEIKAVWATMSGGSSFVSALFHIMNGGWRGDQPHSERATFPI